MKKLKIILLLISLLFVLPIAVKAEENSIKIIAPEMVSKGNEMSVDIVLSSDVAVDGFKATFTYETSALELLNYELKDNWKQASSFENSSPVSLDFIHENGIIGNSTIITVKFKVKDDVTKTSTSLSIEGTSKSKEDETIHPLAKNSVSIDIKSRDNTLKGLKLNGVDINNFSPNTYGYTQLVESTVTTANFDAELNDNTATFKEGFAPKQGAPLDYGENVFEIIVVSATGEEKKYSVTVVRQDNRGTDNFLDKLIVNSNPSLFKFDKNTLNYTITTHRLEKIDIEAVSHDPKATAKITQEPEKLIIGKNLIKITVLSEKNEERVYSIIVNNSDKAIDTRLKSLDCILGLEEEIDFSPDVYDYEVLYKSKYRETLAIKEDEYIDVMNRDDAQATCEKRGEISRLKPGDKLTIKVYARDGTKNAESYYTITFKKDTRLNFFLLLGIIILIVLLIIFIYLFFKNRNQKKEIEIKEEELQKTKRLEKIIKE